MNVNVSLSTWSADLEQRRQNRLNKIKARLRKQAEDERKKERNGVPNERRG